MAKSAKVEEMQAPDKLSPEWNDYVLQQFAEEELIDGHPTVAGLRRVAEKFVGEIVDSKPRNVWPSQGEGLNRATVEYCVTFLSEPVNKTFGDVADVWVGNTDENFVAYAVAVAATRAEARCLRKALKLRAVAAEELCSKVTLPREERQNDDVISDNQMGFIDTRCKQLNINVSKFMNAGEQTYQSVNQVLKSTASKMIQELNRLFQEQEEIPESLRGYRSDWQKNFKG